uniref:Uncharacterized protein n=1 Tax=viral metagenome TaxID=1070528 RepID=A0A6C0KEI4_9ZZZZ
MLLNKLFKYYIISYNMYFVGNLDISEPQKPTLKYYWSQDDKMGTKNTSIRSNSNINSNIVYHRKRPYIKKDK